MSQEDVAKTLSILNTQLQELSLNNQRFEGEYVVVVENLLHKADLQTRLLLPPGDPCPHCQGSGVVPNT
ncbi:hypothetical protein SIN8267_01832 [Sinobacterium norvegicum]|uniref:Uncharacterized protein n=1 Tax=Sinobacterium norvegicum TaxID=1641715 RepID=A0ABM9AF27_9GAMM|nr:hypothetical protein [Sinobacterium norvegicum]CAH0991718.1 hypothetical protein SIN8267_01832 [Sinobacterium norvegicum]